MFSINLETFYKDDDSKKIILFHFYKFLRKNKKFDRRNNIYVIKKTDFYVKKEYEKKIFFITDNKKEAVDYNLSITHRYLNYKTLIFVKDVGHLKEFHFYKNMTFQNFYKTNKNLNFSKYVLVS
jgi:hypothetical protein